MQCIVQTMTADDHISIQMKWLVSDSVYYLYSVTLSYNVHGRVARVARDRGNVRILNRSTCATSAERCQ